MTGQPINNDFLPSPSAIKEIYKKSKTQKIVASISDAGLEVEQDNNEAIQLTKKIFNAALSKQSDITVNNSINTQTIELLESLGYTFNDHKEIKVDREEYAKYFEERIKDLHAEFSRDALFLRKYLYEKIKSVLTDTRTFENYTNSVLPKIFHQIKLNPNDNKESIEITHKTLINWCMLETFLTINDNLRQTQLKDLLLDEYLFEWSHIHINLSPEDIEFIKEKSLTMIDKLNLIKNTEVEASLRIEKLDELLEKMLTNDLQIVWEYGDCDYEGTPPEGLFQAFIMKWISSPEGQKSLSELKLYIEEQAANQRLATVIKFDWIAKNLPINDGYVTNDFCNLVRFLGFNTQIIQEDVAISWA